jgi:hypothetical protein
MPNRSKIDLMVRSCKAGTRNRNCALLILVMMFASGTPPAAADNWAADLLEDAYRLLCPVDRNISFATQDFGKEAWCYPKSQVVKERTFQKNFWQTFTIRSPGDVQTVSKYYVDFLKRRGWKIRHADSRRGRISAVCRPAKLIVTVTQEGGSDSGFCIVAVSMRFEQTARC